MHCTEMYFNHANDEIKSIKVFTLLAFCVLILVTLSLNNIWGAGYDYGLEVEKPTFRSEGLRFDLLQHTLVQLS